MVKKNVQGQTPHKLVGGLTPNKSGILVVYKQPGLSTFDLVRAHKRENSFKGKIGHSGTLDPFARGAVLLLLGEATKKFADLQKLPKTYLAGIRLGWQSTTGDPAGAFKKVSDAKPTMQEIKNVLQGFLGKQNQQIPAFSAAKYHGTPLYKLALQGKAPQKEKQIEIYDIKLLAYKYPLLTIEVKCSSGTYIRQIAEDIGKCLKTGAFLYFLQRAAIGNYSLKNTEC